MWSLLKRHFLRKLLLLLFPITKVLFKFNLKSKLYRGFTTGAQNSAEQINQVFIGMTSAVVLFLSCSLLHVRGAGVAQWWECSPTTNVSRVRFLDPASSADWVCCWFSPLLQGFFSGFSGLPPSSKTNNSKFQFDREFEGHGFTSWRLLCVALVKQS